MQTKIIKALLNCPELDLTALHGLQVPNACRMLSLLQALAQSSPEKKPQLTWQKVMIRRYRQRLYLQEVAL